MSDSIEVGSKWIGKADSGAGGTKVDVVWVAGDLVVYAYSHQPEKHWTRRPADFLRSFNPFVRVPLVGEKWTKSRGLGGADYYIIDVTEKYVIYSDRFSDDCFFARTIDNFTESFRARD